MLQYQRHNFYMNFSNAIATKDSGMAIDILVHEINELALDFPIDVKKVLNDSGVTTPAKVAPKELALLLNANLSKNAKLQTGLTNLIIERHKDPHIGSELGAYDRIYPNPATASASPAQQIAMGIAAIAPQIKDSHISESIDQKLKQRGFVAVITPGKIFKGVLIGALAVTAVILIVKHFSKNDTQPQPAVA